MFGSLFSNVFGYFSASFLCKIVLFMANDISMSIPYAMIR